jgi:hypothetical protein
LRGRRPEVDRRAFAADRWRFSPLTVAPFREKLWLPRIRDLPQRLRPTGSLHDAFKARPSACPRPVRLVAQDSALSRRRQGFDSPTGYFRRGRPERQASSLAPFSARSDQAADGARIDAASASRRVVGRLALGRLGDAIGYRWGRFAYHRLHAVTPPGSTMSHSECRGRFDA